jgi:putative transposase
MRAPRRPVPRRDDLELATADWVWWFNHNRIHGSIGHVPPVEFEAAYNAALRDTAA